jgi:hypothetical protein
MMRELLLVALRPERDPEGRRQHFGLAPRYASPSFASASGAAPELHRRAARRIKSSSYQSVKTSIVATAVFSGR